MMKLSVEAAFPRSFSSRHFLQLLEAHGLTGAWAWSFATNDHAWSPGLYRLLGLEPGVVKPSYDIILNMVHPEDRVKLQTPERIVLTGHLGDHTVRVIRPDGSLRILVCRGEVSFDPEGRPRSAAGTMLDVTDRERVVAALSEERRHRRILFEQFQTWTHSSRYTTNHRIASKELLSLKGISQDEFKDDWTLTLVREDRNHMRDHVREQITIGKPFSVQTRFLLAEGGHGHFRGVFVPVLDASGRIGCWATMTSRATGPNPPPSGDVQRGLEQAVDASHLRAARGLLDWTMESLAAASGLSLSTIRRLEDAGEEAVSRSRHKAIAALRGAGIRFIMLDDGTIAVAKA